MKARKLIQDVDTKKQNIVWFGSYGYEPLKTTYKMKLNKSTIQGVLLPSDDLIPRNDLLLRGEKYYNHVNLNLYFKKLSENQFINIFCANNIEFTWVLQFNLLDKNKTITVEKVGIGSSNCNISIDNLINEYNNYNIISNFTLEIIVNEQIDDEFIITYNTKKTKFAYDRTKYIETTYKENSNTIIEIVTNKYTYTESQLFNYSIEQQGVRDALIPRLSVIKGELWYKASYGLPLMDKIKSKGIYDSIIVDYITSYPDVINLEEFTSNFDNHEYTFNCIVNTIYNEKIILSNKLY